MIYVIMAEKGEYSDRECWAVEARTSKTDAESIVNRLNGKYRSFTDFLGVNRDRARRERKIAEIDRVLSYDEKQAMWVESVKRETDFYETLFKDEKSYVDHLPTDEDPKYSRRAERWWVEEIKLFGQ